MKRFPNLRWMAGELFALATLCLALPYAVGFMIAMLALFDPSRVPQ